MRVFDIHNISSSTQLIEAAPLDDWEAEGIVQIAASKMPMIYGEKETKQAVDDGSILPLIQKTGDDRNERVFVVAFSELTPKKAAREIQGFLEARDFDILDEDGNLTVDLSTIIQQGEMPYEAMKPNSVNRPQNRVWAGVPICPVGSNGVFGDADPATIDATRTVTIGEKDTRGFFYFRPNGALSVVWLREASGDWTFLSQVKDQGAIVQGIMSSTSARTGKLPSFRLNFGEFSPARVALLVGSDEKAEEHSGPLSNKDDDLRGLDDMDLMELIEDPEVTSAVEGNMPIPPDGGMALIDEAKPSGALLSSRSSTTEVPPAVTSAIASVSKGGTWRPGYEALVVDHSQQIGVVQMDDLYSEADDGFAGISLPGGEEIRHPSANQSAATQAPDSAPDDPFSGIAFTATGRFPNMDRSDIEDFVIGNGGSFKSSMSGKVDVLLKGSTSSPTTKFEEAQDRGLPIVSLSDLKEVVVGSRTMQSLM